MASGTPLDSTGLANIYNNIKGPMDTAETNLRTLLGGLKGGGQITSGELLNLQFEIAQYTVTTSVFSSIIKEFGDALKQVANKIG